MKIFKAYKNWKQLQQIPPGMLEISSKLFDFINRVSIEERAMTTELAIFDNDTGDKKTVATLWAATGDANPIKRCNELKNQTEELKRWLSIAIRRTLTDEELANVELMIKAFN